MNCRSALGGVFAALTLLILPGTAVAATPWQALTKTTLAARGGSASVETAPARFKAFALDRPALTRSLADDVISIPDPTGTLVRFRVEESPVMEQGLAAKHPTFKTYAGVGIDDPSQTVRLDLTSLGFHASVRGAGDSWYVDPYYRNDQSAYAVYAADQLESLHGPFSEGEIEGRARDLVPPAARAGGFVDQRVYRLALASDPTYATYFDGITHPENVTAAKVTLLNRVNQIYNDDLGIRMELIDATDDLNFDTEAEFHGVGTLGGGACGPVNPCYPDAPDPTLADTEIPPLGEPPATPPSIGEACSPTTLEANAGAINGALGDPTGASYDIGHLALGRNGGGIAGLGVVGDDTMKAMGCTGIPTPKGDFYAVDYFAHEVGHQFGGNHTFGGTQFNCAGGNRNDDTSVEPGSGSSVMAYAGICRQDNLQPHSDPYFSQRSIDEIQAYVTSDDVPGGANQGDQVVNTANHPPVVTAPSTVTIPPRTPFTLTGTATDQDAGQSLVYLWEQNDTTTDGTTLVSNDKPAGALFRVFGTYAPVTGDNAILTPAPGENVATAGDASRTFPDPAQIAVGNTNAATGSCPPVTVVADDQPAPPPVAVDVIDCYSEFLPTSARTLAFRLTARDRALDGGGVSHADTTVNIVGTAPFRVTSTQATAAPSTGVPVTWDVAGTAGAPANVTQVRISYSTDGGKTFPSVLAEATPNDGMETVTIPATLTETARFRVEAVGGAFFDVSHVDLKVAVPPAPATSVATTAPTAPTAAPSSAPTATPAKATVRPDLSLTVKRPKVSRKRRVTVLVRCRVSGTVEVPARCRGSVRLFAKLGKRVRRIAHESYTVAPGSTRVVQLKIRKRAAKKLLRTHTLVTQVRATANGQKTRRTVRLRR